MQRLQFHFLFFLVRILSVQCNVLTAESMASIFQLTRTLVSSRFCAIGAETDADDIFCCQLKLTYFLLVRVAFLKIIIFVSDAPPHHADRYPPHGSSSKCKFVL